MLGNGEGERPSCDHVRELIGAHIDGELAGPDADAVAAHLATCPSCQATARDIARIGRQIAAVGRQAVPLGLDARLRAALADADRTATQRHAGGAATGTIVAVADVGEAALPPAADRHRWLSLVLRQAAALAAVAAVSAAITWAVLDRQMTLARVEGDVVTAHIRSLLQETPVQVASADTHTVKPWFAGRVDFAPDVKDLTAEGFPLAGGRLDYLGDRRVGALVYRRRLHLVNVFMWPASHAEQGSVRQLVAKGFNVVTWTKAGITYWAVSDLNPGELRHLQSLL